MLKDFDVNNLTRTLDSVDDFIFVEGLLSNSELKHVTDGLLNVYPELKRPLEFYFLSPYLQLAYSKSVFYTMREYFGLIDKGYLSELDVSSDISLRRDFSVLECSVKDSEKDLISFYKGAFKFLSEYRDYVHKNEYDFIGAFLYSGGGDEFKKMKSNCPYGGEFIHRLGDVLKSDKLAAKLYNSVSDSSFLKRLGDKSWNLFVASLNFIPKTGVFSVYKDLLDFRLVISHVIS